MAVRVRARVPRVHGYRTTPAQRPRLIDALIEFSSRDRVAAMRWVRAGEPHRAAGRRVRGSPMLPALLGVRGRRCQESI